MAAGCTLADEAAGGGVDCSTARCSTVAAEWLDKATLTRTLRTDGPLAVEWFNPQTVGLLDAQVWGQGFEAPMFCDEVQVLQQRLVGEKHLKLRHCATPVQHERRCHLVQPRPNRCRAARCAWPTASV
jgi:single-stranded-DNA-specific exonuclease